MRIACWIPETTDIHSEYVILIAFLRQQWLRERASLVLLCIHCLSCYWDILFFLWKLTAKLNLHDFRLPPRSRREQGSSGLLQSSKVFFDVTSLMFRSYGGPTHSYVTSLQDRSPQDRYLTSHRYSARPTRLPSPTAELAPEALLTRSEFPFVVTLIHCYNRHVWSYSFFFIF